MIRNLRCEGSGGIMSFTREAERLLLHYNWPGNVRELENCIEGLVIAGDTDHIDGDDLPQPMTGNAQKDACGLTNPRRPTDADVIAIYTAAL